MDSIKTGIMKKHDLTLDLNTTAVSDQAHGATSQSRCQRENVEARLGHLSCPGQEGVEGGSWGPGEVRKASEETQGIGKSQTSGLKEMPSGQSPRSQHVECCPGGTGTSG